MPKTARATSLRPGADQAGQRDDLAGAARRSETSGKTPSPGQVLDLEHDLAGRSPRSPGTARRARGRPSRGRGRRRSARSIGSVQHVAGRRASRDPLAEREDLVEPVRDEQHRRAAVAQRARPRRTAGRPRRRTAPRSARPSRAPGRRATAPWRSRRSAGRRWTARGEPARVERDAEPGEQGRGLARASAAGRSGARRASGWRPMKMFSATRQVGEERRLLVDDRDAGVLGVGRAVQADRLAVDQQLAGVRRCTPARILTSVDLPAPFSPTSACASPA